jgi:hypothetical protein
MVSPYDAAYPAVLLANGLKDRLAQATATANAVYKVLSKNTPIIAQAEQSLKKGFRLVVDATESTLDAIESGRIKLTMENSGKLYAQIRDAEGYYGSKLPIKKDYFRKGIDPVQMATALQMKAIEEQLEGIADQLNLIDYSVREVLQGQQNDRIGLYYSGMALFLEARNVSDGEMRNALIAQALRSLSESTFQLALTMQSDIRYLESKEYNKTAKGKRVEAIDGHMQSINRAFAFIHQSTMLRAGIYCEQGELAAMSTVLEEYSRFIANVVAQNAALLSQCDTSDDGTERGLWESRAKLRLDVSDFARQLNAPEKTIYLGIAKESA